MDGHELVQAMRKAVETVPGLGDLVEPFGLNYQGKVIGLGVDKPERPSQVNNLAVSFFGGTVGSLPHEYLTRVMPEGQEEEVVA